MCKEIVDCLHHNAQAKSFMDNNLLYHNVIMHGVSLIKCTKQSIDNRRTQLHQFEEEEEKKTLHFSSNYAKHYWQHFFFFVYRNE